MKLKLAVFLVCLAILWLLRDGLERRFAGNVIAFGKCKPHQSAQHTTVELEEFEREIRAIAHLVKIFPEELLFTVARVGMLDRFSWPALMRLDVGRRDGVRKYELVIWEGFVLGRIAEVKDSWSKVITVFSPEFYIDARFEESGILALLRGSPDGMMKVYLRKGHGEFVEGEKVVSGGLSFSDPAGIPIGIYKRGRVEVFAIPEEVFYVSVTKRQRVY